MNSEPRDSNNCCFFLLYRSLDLGVLKRRRLAMQQNVWLVKWKQEDRKREWTFWSAFFETTSRSPIPWWSWLLMIGGQLTARLCKVYYTMKKGINFYTVSCYNTRTYTHIMRGMWRRKVERFDFYTRKHFHWKLTERIRIQTRFHNMRLNPVQPIGHRQETGGVSAY